MPCFEAWPCGKAVEAGPARRASSRGSARTRHGRAAHPRGGRSSPREPLVRRRGDLTAAHASASSARQHQGASVAMWSRGLPSWNSSRLVILINTLPLSRSHSRAMPILTPLPQNSEPRARWQDIHLDSHPRRRVGRDRYGRSHPHVGGPGRPFYALDEGASGL